MKARQIKYAKLNGKTVEIQIIATDALGNPTEIYIDGVYMTRPGKVVKAARISNSQAGNINIITGVC